MKKRAVSEQTLSEIIGILMNSTVNATTSQVLKLVKDVEESEQVQDQAVKETRAEMRAVEPEPKKGK